MGFLQWLTQFLSLILFHFHFHTTFSSSFSSTPLCAHDQSLALLQFKRSFSINTSLDKCQDIYPKTTSWRDGTDCCLWDGVTCDMKTGQVIGLDLSCSMLYGTLHSNNTLFSLYHLQKLDLSGNDFNSSHISSQFGHLSNLTHLSLNYSGFAGQVPPKFSLLSKLVSLDLSYNDELALEPIVFDKLVRNLTELRELHLNWVNMSLVVPSSLTNLSSSLSSLELGICGLQGKLTDNVLQRPSLQLLDLSGNYDLTGSFPPFNVSIAFSSLGLSQTGISIDLEHDSINNLKSLKNLYLSECHFVKSNLAPLGNLTQLTELYLSFNLFSGHIPFSLGKLQHLQHLNLGYNNFTGPIPSDFEQRTELVSLDLSGNTYLTLDSSSFNKLVQNLTKLRVLYLGNVNMSLVEPNSLMNLSSSLWSLSLSSSGLRGKFPSNIFLLPNLEFLFLSGNEGLTGSFPSSNVSSALKGLGLSDTRISVDLENDFIRNLKSLEYLYLSECHFVGSNLAPLGNLTQLTALDLSFNRISGHIPFSLGKLKHLQYLNLGFNNFTGPIPYDFEQLTELVSLFLDENTYLTLDSSSFNKLVQNLTELRDLSLDSVNMSLVEPNSLTNLSSSLSCLSLSSSGLRGKFPSKIFLLPNIESLYLSGNEGLTGSFPSSNVSSALKGLGLSDTRISVDLENDFIRNLKSLEYLYLRNCTITKRSNLAMLGNLTQLTELHLSHNHFSGHIPSSFGNLVKLGWLDLSSNNFTGQIPSSFGNLVKLWWLDLSSNNFTGQISDFLGNLTQLEYLLLSDNQFLGPIPSEKSSFANLLYLHLSDNLLNGTIPPFLFSHPSLRNLDLRNNLFTGNLSEFQCNSFEWLDLSNNHLHGPIPNSIFNQEYLTVLNLASNNKLTGEISSSVCKLASLQALDLSNNSLSGFIPQCLWNFTNSLSVLHLGMNNLQGTVPAKFSIGNSLGYLNLNGNELEGKIPTSIVNCTKLEVLDLGNNKIEDKFPYFLERLQELQVLVLKSNKLYGFVKGPTTNNSFSKLRIFDISNNNLSGELPKGYFNDFEAMMSFNQNMIYMSSRNVSYDYSIRMTWKGLEMEFVKIRNTLTSIDLSDNNFTGEIPESIGKLKALGQLNLSHNSFTGYIQPSLGNLTNLESLDLSSNLLTGRIPMQLADLTFLSALNLSHNQLQGPIPKGKQFNTFNNDSFEGNLGLCGFPISKECNSGETQLLPPSTSEEGDDSILFRDGFGWKAVAMGYGCGFVFGVTMGYIMFRTRKPTWFVKVVEGQWNLTVRRRKKNVHGNGVRRN